VVCGQAGTGRAAVAREIHLTSRRALAPLVALHCGEVAGDVLRRELFGYVRAAVREASHARAGFVHSAAGGTLLLEGLAATDLAFLEDVVSAAGSRRARMLGATEGQPFDLRLVLVSELDAAGLVAAAEPWSSLPSRLPWIWIAVPALAERGEDLPELFLEALAEAAVRCGRSAPSLSEPAAEVVSEYPWPGNLPEMDRVASRVLERLTGSQVDATHLPMLHVSPRTRARSLAELEAEHILTTLESCRGNRSEAARRLGIDRKTLRAKLARAGAGRDG
jgi:two-component system, NtrC family, response regulator HydG